MARMTDALGREVNLEMVRILRRASDTAMAPLPMLNLRPHPDQGLSLNPFLLPIQLPYLVLDRMIARVESALELSQEDRESLTALRRLVAILVNASRRSVCYYCCTTSVSIWCIT
jgi:hypothetical protein